MALRQSPLPPKIGRFRIDAVLGAGGMGEVYKGFDQTLQRTVAIKTVRGDINNPDYLARLYREAQACARLQHPNIVTVHEAGEVDGVVYIAMEFLKGEDLAKVLARGEMSFEERISILVRVLDALEHAHNEGVIHRDIKPSNIQRLPDGTVKVVDFGLARIARADTMTATGSIMGTPHYASPEQLRGQNVDRRTDIYSSGAVAYELCSGRRPFEGQDDSVATLILKVLQDPLPPMDADFSRTFPEIEAIISKSMAKSADDRYQSAADMRDALAAFLAGSRDAISRTEATVIISGRLSMPTALTPKTPIVAPPPISDGGTRLADGAAGRTADRPTMTGPGAVAGGVVPPLVQAPPAGTASETRSRLVDPKQPAPTVEPRKPAPQPKPKKGWLIGGAVAVVAILAFFTYSRFGPGSTGTNEPPSIAGGQATPTPTPPSGGSGDGTTAPPVDKPSVSTPPSPGPIPPAGGDVTRGGGAALPAAPTGEMSRGNSAAPPAPAPRPAPVAESAAKQLFYGGAAPGAQPAEVKNTGLRFSVIRQNPAGLEEDVDADKTRFRNGDRIRFEFQSNVDGYFYVIYHGTSGEWELLYPNAQINASRNNITAGRRHVVPDGAWLEMEGPPGEEEIFVFLSRDRMPGLPGVVTRTEAPKIAAVVNEAQKNVQSRDLKLVADEAGSAKKTGKVTYVVNRDEVGKAVTTSFKLTHAP